MEVEKMSFPKDWKVVRLGDVCEKAQTVKRNEKSPTEELLYLDISSVDNQRNKVVAHKTYQWKDAPSRAQQIVKVDDVLFSTVRTYLRNIAPVTDAQFNNQIASTGFTVIRGSKNQVDSRFLLYYVLSETFLRPLNELQTGTSYPAVRDKDVFAQNIPLPPLAEQQRIVAKIEELFSELDAGKQELEKAAQQLKVYRQAVLKWAFEGRLTNGAVVDGDLPDGWKAIELGGLLRFIGSGVTPKGGQSTYQDSGVLFIRSQNVYPNRLVLEDAAFISEEVDERMKRSRVLPNDVLLNITGASIGRCAFVPNDFQRANVNQHVCILRTKREDILPEYLSSYLNAPAAQHDIMGTQLGVTRQGLNYEQIRRMKIAFPPLEEQHRIVQEIEARLSVCDKIEGTIAESLQQAEALRQSILKKAFEGKLL